MEKLWYFALEQQGINTVPEDSVKCYTFLKAKGSLKGETMEKLNNDELQNVSAGGDDHDIPRIDVAMVMLWEHGGRCKYCGTPVTELEPIKGPINKGVYYSYLFQCKCPAPTNLMPVNYYPDTNKWYFSQALVD